MRVRVVLLQRRASGVDLRQEMTPPRIGTSRRRLFLTGTLLLPLLAFASLELALRSFGFGGGDALFVADPEWPDWQHASPDVMRRYMVSGEQPAVRIAPMLFRTEKPAGGLRIVVQGSSTAAGFPFGRWGGLAGMLADRLEAARPDGSVEVVTTAMAAVNSNTLLDLVDEIIAVDPDAVLVYAGHNEYVGVHGVASAFGSTRSLALTRAKLRLGRLRTFQLITRVIACLHGGVDALARKDRRTLFAEASRGSRVEFGSETYHAGIEQFEANIGEQLARYRAAGVRVYIGTLASNDEFPPLARGPSPDVDPARWASSWDRYNAAVAADDLAAERAAIDELSALDRDSADAWYARGRLALREGREHDAREALATARDRDTLRFRAPTAINRSIRSLAARHGAVLVDVEQGFRSASPDGVIGGDWLLEHVHPNAEGYFLLADLYYDALRRDGMLGDLSAAPDREIARRDMPISAFDRALVEHDMKELLAGLPFSDPPRAVVWGPPRDEIDRLARRYRDGGIDWLQTMEAYFQLKQREGDLAESARIARLVAHEYPSDAASNRIAGRLLIESGQPARALYYLARSLRAAPDESSTRALVARAERALEAVAPGSLPAAAIDPAPSMGRTTGRTTARTTGRTTGRTTVRTTVRTTAGTRTERDRPQQVARLPLAAPE